MPLVIVIVEDITMQNFKVILFDIDDTLLSFQGYVKQAMKDGLEHFNLGKFEEWMYPIFTRTNDKLWRQIEDGTLTFEELKRIRWAMVLKEIGIDFDGVTFETYFRDRLFYSAVLEEGAVEILEHLKERYMLCVVSNGPYEQQINRLKVGNLDKYFSHVFISGKVGHSKPTKEFFDCCFKEIRECDFPELKPEEVLIVGDSMTADIGGGKAYGLKTCLYTRYKEPEGDLSTIDHKIKELVELKNIL